MRFDDARLGVEMKTPDALKEHRARYNATAVAHQDFEQAKFARLQVNHVAAARHLPAYEIDLEVADLEARFLALGVRTAGKCVDAREKLREGERLNQIIVGAGVQAFDAIVDAAERRQEQDRARHVRRFGWSL